MFWPYQSVCGSITTNTKPFRLQCVDDQSTNKVITGCNLCNFITLMTSTEIVLSSSVNDPSLVLVTPTNDAVSVQQRCLHYISPFSSYSPRSKLLLLTGFKCGASHGSCRFENTTIGTSSRFDRPDRQIRHRRAKSI